MRPEISVIQRFCERGFEVYMIRWNCDHEQDIGFYQMISFIREVLGKIGNTSIFGYCTGGIIALLFTSFYPKWVNSLSLLGWCLNSIVSNGVCTCKLITVDEQADDNVVH
jgi:polyhydroxyalkanoate synthase subunit PhaC